MNPGELDAVVERSFEALIAAGEPHHGLFPSVMDRRTVAMLEPLPPPIPGQRPGDRARRGANLTHDEPTLAAMYGLSAATGVTRWSDAADRYLGYFARECTGTKSGLYPWGEHSFYDFVDRRAGEGRGPNDPPRSENPIHDHLRAAPLWLWRKLLAFNRGCVERFAEGLDNHWTRGEPREYIRHAYIQRNERHPRHDVSNDFPRHSGFYVFDWAVAYADTGRADFLAQLRLMMDYWWDKRLPDGMLHICSRMPVGDKFDRTRAPAQTLSLASSLLEAAGVLREKEPELAATMRERARVYIDAFEATPQDAGRGEFVLTCRDLEGLERIREVSPVWGSKYGKWPAAYPALNAALVYRLTNDARLLARAIGAARAYAATPMPEGVAVPAMDAGLALNLLNEVFEITGERPWLAAAQRVASELAAKYCDTPLPRGAAGIDYYDSQMGPGFLLHALLRTALLSERGGPCVLPTDYTAR